MKIIILYCVDFSESDVSQNPDSNSHTEPSTHLEASSPDPVLRSYPESVGFGFDNRIIRN